jgi:hypothetical protein
MTNPFWLVSVSIARGFFGDELNVKRQTRDVLGTLLEPQKNGSEI